MEHAEQTLASRSCRLAKVSLYLALGEPARALQGVDELLATAPNIRRPDRHPPPQLLLSRAEALLALGSETEAEHALQMAQVAASVRAATPLSWRIFALLSTLYTSQGRHAEAATASDAARAFIDQIAATLPEQEGRARYIEQACRRLPDAAMHKRRRQVAEAGVLTMRELEVATLIAQGKSNREIAAQLTITERTVTTHISHIFDKLDLRVRSQIAVWVTQQSTSKPADRRV
jgi:non-specific serine/threonine protein kinase